ncbi:MAG: aldo/keto reductase [Gammaproteobacteria bacterium]|nr:aldo/keto reductase [Gammaproteobacteria bacterium]
MLSRRDFLIHVAAWTAVPSLPARAAPRSAHPSRPIPKTGEPLPVVGLGTTKAVSQLAERGTSEFKMLLRTLLDGGGKVVDTWPRSATQDELTGEALQAGGLVQDMFLATKVDAVGAEAGRAMLERTRRLYGKRSDLIQVISLRDLKTQWSVLKEWKDADKARYIGATVSSDADHEAMMDFIRGERPDFIQVNYSVVETQAETGVLPLAADLGIAVLINRPFMNGGYFSRVRGVALPDWAAEFDCHSWAQFSLKYILAHPAVTCVLTETTKPKHLLENLGTAYGRLPDAETKRRMREVMQFI